MYVLYVLFCRFDHLLLLDMLDPIIALPSLDTTTVDAVKILYRSISCSTHFVVLLTFFLKIIHFALLKWFLSFWSSFSTFFFSLVLYHRPHLVALHFIMLLFLLFLLLLLMLMRGWMCGWVADGMMAGCRLVGDLHLTTTVDNIQWSGTANAQSAILQPHQSFDNL